MFRVQILLESGNVIKAALKSTIVEIPSSGFITLQTPGGTTTHVNCKRIDAVRIVDCKSENCDGCAGCEYYEDLADEYQ